MLLSNKLDFIKMSKVGAELLAIGSPQKRCILDETRTERIIHPLESISYLKIDRDNFVTFECADENRIITVQQEYSREDQNTGEETNFDKIYSIKIHEITLRELLLFKSLYVSRTQSDIVQLVQD